MEEDDDENESEEEEEKEESINIKNNEENIIEEFEEKKENEKENEKDKDNIIEDDDEEEEDDDDDDDDDEGEEEEEEDNDDDDESEEDEEDEEEEDDDDDEDEESAISLMEMKRIKQQQQQQQQVLKKALQRSTNVKTNIKIQPPIPKIIVHTRREEKIKMESENHEYVDVQQLMLDDSMENVFDIEHINSKVLAKLKKSIPSQPKEPKKVMSLVASASSMNKMATNKKDKVINLTKLLIKENKEKRLNKKPVATVRTKKMRGRNALKAQILTETSPNKLTTISPPTRGKGRPKGHCGRPRKRWPNEPQVVVDDIKNDLFNVNKENKENKFTVEENGNTLFIKPEIKEKSSETIITQVSVTTTASTEPITVITSTVPSSVITSTRNSHFYSSSPKQCTYCGSTSTPLWRHGPPESPRLCNSCGVKWKRGKILQSQPSGFPWNSISVDKKTEEFRSLMRCITSDKVLKVLGILKTCMTIAMKRQLDRGEEVKIDIRNIDSRAWSQLYRFIKCQ